MHRTWHTYWSQAVLNGNLLALALIMHFKRAVEWVGGGPRLRPVVSAAMPLAFVLLAVSSQFSAAVGQSEYDLCHSGESKADVRLFACSKIISDRSQPEIVRSQALTRRGSAFVVKGDETRALSDYTEAIRLDPRNGDAYRSRALLFEHKGQYDRAVLDHNHVVRLRPDDMSSFMERGIAFQRDRDYEKAIADYKKAIQLNPQFAATLGVFAMLGDVYRAQGEKDSLSEYRKFLGQHTNITAAQEALRNLGN